MKLTNIILPSPPTGLSTYDIEITNHTITSISPHTHPPSSPDEQDHCPPPSLLLPTLCHPHIHLDKAYLLTSNHNHPAAYPPCSPRPRCSLDRHQSPSTRNQAQAQSRTQSQSQIQSHHRLDQPQYPSSPELPDYAPLAPLSGTFPEALSLTSRAKHLYTPSDLYLRGAQLLATSYTQGVTSARCFVEVDHVTCHATLDVGLQLKREWEGKVHVQICVFAQDTVFSGKVGEENRRLIEGALEGDSLRKQEQGGKGEEGEEEVPETEETEVAEAEDAEAEMVKKIEKEQNHDESRTKPKNNGGPSRSRPRRRRGIEVLGTTPYVESSRANAIKNIEWAITTALKYDLHLDFHLDYNLDPSVTREPERLMVWDVLRLLEEHCWPKRKSGMKNVSEESEKQYQKEKEKKKQKKKEKRKRIKTVVLGHSTALTLLSHASLVKLSTEIRESGLPIYFVGLPASDVYMMGRADTKENTHRSDMHGEIEMPLNRSLGTLNIPSLIKNYALRACLGVNNVGNAFTPFGTGDPLQLASWGVGLFHAGGEGYAEILFRCISSGARESIGLEDYDEEEGEEEEEEEEEEQEGKASNQMNEGKTEDVDHDVSVSISVNNSSFKAGDSIANFGLLLISNEEFIGNPDNLGVKVPARRRISVRDVVWDVPEVRLRSVIR